MGNLLKVLTCTDLEQGPNFFLDFENAQPTESEKDIYNQVNVVLKDAEGILDDLQSYRGAGLEIREAIQHATDEKLQEKAWGAVVPLVGKLKKFYEFSQRLEAALRGLLGALTSTPYSPTQHLEREQALAKQFAEILHFTLRFDELKMTNPAIQNDFSYYRRTLSRMRINNVPAEGENEVNNELANRMSLFYAEATPMLKTLSDATTKFVSENKNLPIENTTDCLSTMASVCRVMLETPEYRSRFTNEETVSFCLRVMVGVIILYDHVHPVGAFAKTSKIDMKGCIKVLKEQPPNSVEGLLNALRFMHGEQVQGNRKPLPGKRFVHGEQVRGTGSCFLGRGERITVQSARPYGQIGPLLPIHSTVNSRGAPYAGSGNVFLRILYLFSAKSLEIPSP
ncbi:CYFIP-related Rac1 interactor B [Mantella aurantiaca]